MGNKPTTEELLLAAEVRKLAFPWAKEAAMHANGMKDTPPTPAQWEEAIDKAFRELTGIAMQISLRRSTGPS